MLVAEPHPPVVRLTSSTLFAETLNYYRVARHLTWLGRVDRDSMPKDSDYYILTPDDATLISQLKLRVIHEDAVSGQVVAARAKQSR